MSVSPSAGECLSLNNDQLAERLDYIIEQQGKLISLLERSLTKDTDLNVTSKQPKRMLKAVQPSIVVAADFWNSVLVTEASLVNNYDLFKTWLESFDNSTIDHKSAVAKPTVVGELNSSPFSQGLMTKGWPRTVPRGTKHVLGWATPGWKYQTDSPLTTYDFVTFGRVTQDAALQYPEPAGIHDTPKDPKAKYRYGILAVLKPFCQGSGKVLTFDSLALIFAALGNGRCNIDHRSQFVHDGEKCAHNFLARHVTLWPTNESRFWASGNFGWFVSQFHLRSFVVEEKQPDQASPSAPVGGLQCERENADFSLLTMSTSALLSSSNAPQLTERRYSLALNVGLWDDTTDAYTIVLCMDSDSSFRGYATPAYLNCFNLDDKTKELDITNSRRFSGLSHFQRLLCVCVDAWKRDWIRTLSEIDNTINIKMSQVLEIESRKGLMYDDPSLQQSAFYFSLLQLLRIFSLVITRNVEGMRGLREKSLSALKPCTKPPLPAEFDNVEPNWDAVVSRHEAAARELLDRISSKIQEVESLRDGLFNAQSVKEAVKGTQINQYLLVFTVVTLLYLPPTFVATFEGMHLFDVENDTVATQRRFWLIFGVVSGMTYLIAVAMLSGVDQRSKIMRFLTRWFRLGTRVRRRSSTEGTTPEPDSSDEKCSGEEMTPEEQVMKGQGFLNAGLRGIFSNGITQALRQAQKGDEEAQQGGTKGKGKASVGSSSGQGEDV